MKPLKIIVLAISFVVLMIFVIQNQVVLTHEFPIGIDLKVINTGIYSAANAIIIIVFFFLGVIFAVMFGAFHAGSLRKELREARQKVRELESKAASALRTPPPPPPPPVVAKTPKSPDNPFTSSTSDDSDED